MKPPEGMQRRHIIIIEIYGEDTDNSNNQQCKQAESRPIGLAGAWASPQDVLVSGADRRGLQGDFGRIVNCGHFRGKISSFYGYFEHICTYFSTAVGLTWAPPTSDLFCM